MVENVVSLKQLYNMLKPAFLVKLRLLKYRHYNNISSNEIWYYLQETIWKQSSNLTLSKMVDDIINCDNVLLKKFLSK